MKPRFKIDFYDFAARPFGLYYARSISLFGSIDWRLVEAFDEQDKARAFYEKAFGVPVTPRWGKAVEINALWYNALRLLEDWLRTEQGEAAARPIAAHADRVRQSFNRRFWNAEGQPVSP